MLETSRGERKSAWARAPARRALISVAAFRCSSDAGIAPANLNMTRKPPSPRGGSAGAQLEMLNLVLRHMEFHERKVYHIGIIVRARILKNDFGRPGQQTRTNCKKPWKNRPAGHGYAGEPMSVANYMGLSHSDGLSNPMWAWKYHSAKIHDRPSILNKKHPPSRG